MPKFLFAYHGGHLPEGAEAVVGPQWKAWMDGLGAQGLDRGGPLKPTRTLAAGGAVADTDRAREITGYSVIMAADFDEALAIAKRCPQTRAPHVDGTIEIAELMEM